MNSNPVTAGISILLLMATSLDGSLQKFFRWAGDGKCHTLANRRLARKLQLLMDHVDLLMGLGQHLTSTMSTGVSYYTTDS